MRWEAAEVARHNEEVEQVWRNYHAGTPSRVPVTFNFSKRFYLLTPWLNERGWSFREYFEQPDVQWEVQLRTARWIREQVAQDGPRGRPEEWGGLVPDFQNR